VRNLKIVKTGRGKKIEIDLSDGKEKPMRLALSEEQAGIVAELLKSAAASSGFALSIQIHDQ
jgi:hypothetical protein